MKDELEKDFDKKYQIDFKRSDVEGGVFYDSSGPVSAGSVIVPVQTHSCNIRIIGRNGVIPELENTDALISMCSGMAVGVRTADCVPVLLHAPDIGATAAVHAGWRGSLGRLVEKVVKELKENLGADPVQMKAAFGPCICGDCYEVDFQLARRFAEAGFADCIAGSRNISLLDVNLKQLTESGIPRSNILTAPWRCTFETSCLPSWRRENTDRRLLTWIRLLS